MDGGGALPEAEGPLRCVPWDSTWTWTCALRRLAGAPLIYFNIFTNLPCAQCNYLLLKLPYTLVSRATESPSLLGPIFAEAAVSNLGAFASLWLVSNKPTPPPLIARCCIYVDLVVHSRSLSPSQIFPHAGLTFIRLKDIVPVAFGHDLVRRRHRYE